MNSNTSRRNFLAASGVVAAGALAMPANSFAGMTTMNVVQEETKQADEPLFKISLAEWSLHRALHDGKITNMDFPRIAKEEFGIEAIEYVNQFFKDKANDLRYLTDLKMRCEDCGVKSLLIMVDGEGRLGDPDGDKRTEAVENHYKWVIAARFLGCHSIRVNAGSGGDWDEQRDRAADGLGRLSDFALEYGLNVIVENHGGLSSNGEWLAQVISQVNKDNCGTLPDFGNFRIGNGETYDQYKGVTELMPFAKAVSAKSHKFDDDGNEVNTDYVKMMTIVLDAGYRGYVGIEWEGGDLDEYAGVRATRDLLIKVRDQLTEDLDG